MPKAEKKQSQQDVPQSEFTQLDQLSQQDISEPEVMQLDQPAVQPTDEEIAVRAYHIYLERGVEGNPDDDWLQAKYELSKGSD